MNRARTHLVFIVTLFALLSKTAVGRQQPLPLGRPAPTTDPLRDVLEKKGYVAIPLIKDEGAECFGIECKIGTETVRLCLDTGAESSSLDVGVVKKLGLKLGDEVNTVGVGGVQKGYEVSVRGLSIGTFDTRSMANSLSFVAFDFTVMNAAREQRKLPRVDGLLGQRALRLNSAVIDYSTRTLYLRTPLAGLWPEIEGRWVATGGQEDGRERRIDPNAPPRLEFKDRRFHMTDGTNRYTFGLHVQPGQDRYTMVFFDSKQEFAKELDYKAGGLLKVAGNKLTLCLCLDLSKAKEFPDDFTAPAGSGHLLLEFRREK